MDKSEPLLAGLFQTSVAVVDYTHYVDRDVRHAPGNRRSICGELMSDHPGPAKRPDAGDVLCPECARILASSKGFYRL